MITLRVCVLIILYTLPSDLFSSFRSQCSETYLQNAVVNYELLESSRKKEVCNFTGGNYFLFKKLRDLYMVGRSV